MNSIQEFRVSQVAELVEAQSVCKVTLVVSINHIIVISENLKTFGEFSSVLEVQVKLQHMVEECLFVNLAIKDIGRQCNSRSDSKEKSSGHSDRY